MNTENKTNETNATNATNANTATVTIDLGPVFNSGEKKFLKRFLQLITGVKLKKYFKNGEARKLNDLKKKLKKKDYAVTLEEAEIIRYMLEVAANELPEDKRYGVQAMIRKMHHTMMQHENQRENEQEVL